MNNEIDDRGLEQINRKAAEYAKSKSTGYSMAEFFGVYYTELLLFREVLPEMFGNPLYHASGFISNLGSIYIRRKTQYGVSKFLKNYKWSEIGSDLLELGIGTAAPPLSRGYLAMAYHRGKSNFEEAIIVDDLTKNVVHELTNPGAIDDPKVIEIAEKIRPGYNSIEPEELI